MGNEEVEDMSKMVGGQDRMHIYGSVERGKYGRIFACPGSRTQIIALYPPQPGPKGK